MFNNIFKIKKRHKTTKIHFPDNKNQIFKVLASIINDPNSINDICELNYQTRELSKENHSHLKSIEESLNYQFVDKLYADLNHHLKKKKLYGYRFKYKNDTWDIFSDYSKHIFLGNSKQPNHLVFTHNHDYDGEILIHSNNIEFQILFSIVSDRIFDNFLNMKTKSRYSINLIENFILQSEEII